MNVVATGLWPVDLCCLSHQGRTAHRAVATAATVLLNRSRQGRALYSASDAALRQRALQPAFKGRTINHQLSAVATLTALAAALVEASVWEWASEQV